MYVFPPLARHAGRYGGLKRSWPRTRSLEPMIAHLTAHGLRHAFASVADDTGLSEPTIAALLGHSAGVQRVATSTSSILPYSRRLIGSPAASPI